jgi:hypothetical protein
VCATRSSASGESVRGPAVLAALLGVVAARFSVDDSAEGVVEQLQGSLDEQLLGPTAAARAAQSLLSGPALLRVERACFEPDFVTSALGPSPEPVRELLRALAEGASPRVLLQQGRASSELLESVLGDAARQGAVTAVLLEDEDDALPAARERELRLLEGVADPATARECLLAAARAVSHVDLSRPSQPSEVGSIVDPADVQSLADERGTMDEADRAEPADASEAVVEAVGSMPPPAETPLQGGVAEPGRHTPILASGLAVLPRAPRAMRAPACASARQDVYAASASLLEPEAAEPARAAPTGSLEPSGPAGAAEPEPVTPVGGAQGPANVPLPSAYVPSRRKGRPPRGKSRRSRLLLPVLFGVAGIALAVGARWVRERQPSQNVPAAVEPATRAEPGLTPAPVLPAPEPGPGASAGAESSSPPQASQSELPVELALTPEDGVPKGEGLLEVVAGKNDEVFVNGKLIGKGPVVKVTLKAVPDPYEIRVKLRGEERVRYVVVKDGKRLRLRIAPPWTR